MGPYNYCWAYQMRTFLFISLLLFFAVACNAEPQYKSASEFESVVKSWQLDGKSEGEATIILSKKNFSCKERVCYLDVKGFPCNQKLQVSLVVNNGSVVNTSVWKLPNGELPTVCL